MAYYRPIYDPREETYVAGRQGEHMTVEEYARAAQVRTAAIVPNYSRYALARGMYQDLNTVYNDICPTPQRDDNLYQQMGQIYSQQYNSPIDPAQSQLSVVPYGIHNSGQNRSFSPGMSGSNNDLRNMGMISHVSPPNDQHYPASSHDLTTVASRPDLQWMVTTSNIDMRTVTSPNAMVSHAGQYNPGLTSNVTNSSMADISHHPPPPYGRIQSSLRSHRDIGPSSSTGISHRGLGSRNHKSSMPAKPKGTPGRKRKVEDHQLTPEEASKRHLRRERNKLAAAKCRNRRRELTDRLQGETDILEDHQGMLTQEIVALQQEKDHLEFILASHTPVCKVLTTKHMNQSGNISPVEPRSSCHDNIGLQGDNGANLVAPMEMNSDFGHLTSPISDVHSTLHHHNITNDHPQQATTVSVITAGPSLPPNSDNRLHQTSYSRHHNNSVIVGKENMSGSYSTIQPEDLSTVNHLNSNECRRYPATLCNIDVLDQVSCEPLNTPVCSLATPSNTSAVFTFPNTACMTSNSSANTTGINFSDTFSVPASLDYSSSSIMTTGMNNNFSIPSQISSPYTAISSHSVITSASQRESCSAAHRRSSSSESHHSPDSVQSPKLLSL